MENINNKYKNIIERAILAGIITEDNKHIYLSAVREENDSELSEIESLLNEEKKGKNFSSYYKSENEAANTMAVTNPDKNNIISNQTKIATFDNDDAKSVLSGSTVENYSILDIKRYKYMNDNTDDSTSDASSIKQQNVILKSTHNTKPTSTLSRTIKKPMKDQIIDFNVPIYINLKKKESTIKPCALNSARIEQHEISKTNYGKNDEIKLKTSDKGQSFNKWTFSNAQMSEAKRQPISSKSVKIFADASTSIECTDESHVEHYKNECHSKNKSFERKECTLSTEKTLKQQREKPTLISKGLQTELDKTTGQCDCQTYTTNARRKLKVRDNTISTRHKYKRNESFPMEPKFHEQLGSKKNKINKHIYMPSKIDKCKHCKCRCNYNSDSTKVLSDTNPAESSNEDIVSLNGISQENNTGGKDPERFLNVNIIYQFCDDDNITKNASTQDSLTASDSSKEAVKGKKTCEEHIFENKKAKKNNTIQYLFRIFASMKNKRKLKQSESYLNI